MRTIFSVMRPTLLGLSLLVELVSLAACGATSAGGVTRRGPSPTPVIVDLSDLRSVLMLSHEKEPQDVTYLYHSTLTGASFPEAVECSGKAIFTRSPHRIELDALCPNATTKSRIQVYDYDTLKLTSASNGGTSSTQVMIEPYYLLHNPVYQGTEQVIGTDAYHLTGTLCQYKYCPDTQLWLRVSDLALVKFTQHFEDSGDTDDLAYTSPVFNTGATIAAP